MTPDQCAVVYQLRQEYTTVAVRHASAESVLADCYSNGRHLVADKTFRVAPSGFTQDVSPRLV